MIGPHLPMPHSARTGLQNLSAKAGILLGIVVLVVLAKSPATAQAKATVHNPCPRLSAGSIVPDPPDLFSKNGVLSVDLSYNSTTDADGRTLFCFTTPDGVEQPTFHVNPGDKLIVNVKNNLPAPTAATAMQMATNAPTVCGNAVQDASSVNIHYHGTNTSPACHADNVIRTLINSGEKFQYVLQFPTDEPPGLYWYHPHVHGQAEGAVLGGAAGAIVVEGIGDVQPAVAGLAQRVLILRDQNVAGNPTPGGVVPSWDMSINYVPISYPAFTPAIIQVRPGEKQLWRVVNASADSIFDVQVVYDGVPQTLQVVGLDGVPTGSQDGTRLGKLVPMKHILLATAGRAEFIVTGPSANVRHAEFLTLNIDTGPAGDNDPQRTIAKIQATNNGPRPALTVPAVSNPPGPQRFEAASTNQPNIRRKLYFSEVISNPADPSSPTNFFITVDGATPTLFDPNNPPAIVTTQGSVEDWTIENRAAENHEFHFHQIHFLLLAINGKPVPPEQRQFLDMIQVPYWDGVSSTFPSVTVRMDFTGPDVGDFVYHCHILGHEDNGMMAIIRVLPNTASTKPPKSKGVTASSGSTVTGAPKANLDRKPRPAKHGANQRPASDEATGNQGSASNQKAELVLKSYEGQ
jgi:FtsP/CotA-like multicopper oxidase with cupredoxin domain